MRLAFLVAAALPFACLSAAAWSAEAVPMAAHRALYRLALDSVHGGDVGAAAGTMAYEVTDACESWATRQRLSMQITNRDGQDVELVSDYVTLESKDGLRIQFRMRQTTDSAVTEQVEGSAELDATGGSGTIHYTVPEARDVALPKGTLFPMKHTEALIAAALARQTFLALPIFDGTGDHGAQDSFIVLSDWGQKDKAPYPALADLQSGRAHISFFDRQPKPTKDARKEGTGAPDYEVSMRYYANGVADNLRMDFGDFVMAGTLAEFALLPSHC